MALKVLKCGRCNGRGSLPIYKHEQFAVECPDCEGTGAVKLMSRSDWFYAAFMLVCVAYFVWQLFIRPFF